MKVTLVVQIRNVLKALRVSVYEQEDGKFYVIKVKTDEHPNTPGALTILHGITRDEAIGLAEL